MEEKDAFESVMNYRTGLINYGKRVAVENPDRLNHEEMKALIATIFEKINEIDMKLGYDYHDTRMKVPINISQSRVDMIFNDFVDWYNIYATPSNNVYDYTINNYPVDKYPRVLCVGDGEHVHLGRKLAEKGYTVVSVDPVANKDFTMNKKDCGKSLHIIRGKFIEKCTDMVGWANLIVGSKVTEFTEELIRLKKPTVFTISNNAEIYNMSFKGRDIKSSEDLEEDLKKCDGITVKKGKTCDIYVFDPRERGFEP